MDTGNTNHPSEDLRVTRSRVVQTPHGTKGWENTTSGLVLFSLHFISGGRYKNTLVCGGRVKD